MSKVKMQIGIVTLVLFLFFKTSCYAKSIVMDLVIDGEIIPYSAEEIVLKVDDKEVIAGQMPPIIINERTLVPAREIFETMGASVEWVQELREVNVTLNNSKINLKINSDVATIRNNETVTNCKLEVIAKIINNKTMIPFRVVAEAIGCNVEWVQETRTILVTTPIDSESNTQVNDSKKENIENLEEIKNNEVIEDEEIAESVTKNTLSWVYKNAVEIEKEKIKSEINSKTSIVGVKEDYRSEKYALFIVSAESKITDIKVSTYNNSLVLDIINAKKEIESEYKVSTNEYVEKIRSSQYTTEDVRCVFDLKNTFNYEVELSSDRKNILVKLQKNEINKINYLETVKEGTFTIETSGDINFNVSRLTDSDRIYIDVYNSISHFGNKSSTLSSSKYVEKIRTGINEGNVRFVIDTNDQYNYEFEKISDNKLEVKIKNLDYKNIQYSNLNERVLKLDISEIRDLDINDVEIVEDYMAGVYKVTMPCKNKNLFGTGLINVNDSVIDKVEIISQNNALDIVINPQNNVIVSFDAYIKNSKLFVEVLSPNQKYDEVLVLDAGHGLGATGSKDPGATVSGYYEKDYNMKLVSYVEEYITENSDIKVYLTRTSDSDFMDYIKKYDEKNKYLYGRAQIANEINADMFVSIHNNSMGTNKSQWNGTEVLYNPNKVFLNNKNNVNGLTNKKLATILAEDIINGTGGHYKNNNTEKRDGTNIADGISQRTDLALLNIARVPAVLIELAFMTNEKDLAKLNDEEYLKLASQEIAKSIINTFNEYKLYKQ